MAELSHNYSCDKMRPKSRTWASLNSCQGPMYMMLRYFFWLSSSVRPGEILLGPEVLVQPKLEASFSKRNNLKLTV